MINVRTFKEFTEQPIEIAINIPLDTIENTIQAIPKNKTIITICNKGSGLSAQAAQRLNELGYNAIWLCGGLEKWVA